MSGIGMESSLTDPPNNSTGMNDDPYPAGGGGVTAGGLDYTMLKFINEIRDFTPEAVQSAFFGYVNRLIGLGKFTPRQASATLDRINAMIMLYKMSIPKRRVTPQLCLTLENILMLTKEQIWRATIPRNERELIATQVTENIGGTRGGPPQRRNWPW